jgi:hypothetical protein
MGGLVGSVPKYLREKYTKNIVFGKNFEMLFHLNSLPSLLRSLTSLHFTPWDSPIKKLKES